MKIQAFSKKAVSLLLTFSLLAGLTACGANVVTYDKYDLKPARIIDGNASKEPVANQIDPDDTTQYSAEDIQAQRTRLPATDSDPKPNSSTAYTFRE